MAPFETENGRLQRAMRIEPMAPLGGHRLPGSPAMMMVFVRLYTFEAHRAGTHYRHVDGSRTVA